MWTSQNKKQGFMVVTTHFIDDFWRLQSRVMRCFYFPLHFKEKVKKFRIQEINQDYSKLLVKTGELSFRGYRAVQCELAKIQAICYRPVKL